MTSHVSFGVGTDCVCCKNPWSKSASDAYAFMVSKAKLNSDDPMSMFGARFAVFVRRARVLSAYPHFPAFVIPLPLSFPCLCC